LSSLGLASATALLGLGVPVAFQLVKVLRAARHSQPEEADVILVLGRRLESDCLSSVFAARLDHAAALWRQGMAPRILVTGGLTGRSSRTEAEVGREHLLSAGIPEGSLLVEERSRHTLENLYHVREMMRANGWRRMLLVSDPLHLARAAALARGFGLEISCGAAPASSPDSRVAWWWRAWTQAFMLHWYRVGVAYSRLLGSPTLLERVT
jgi:uncharacterized SAM-binding protein YcdF (DUF218 family)